MQVSNKCLVENEAWCCLYELIYIYVMLRTVECMTRQESFNLIHPVYIHTYITKSGVRGCSKECLQFTCALCPPIPGTEKK